MCGLYCMCMIFVYFVVLFGFFHYWFAGLIKYSESMFWIFGIYVESCLCVCYPNCKGARKYYFFEHAADNLKRRNIIWFVKLYSHGSQMDEGIGKGSFEYIVCE